MKNKGLQEERMRGYFIQATKDILKSEGVKRLSVRNIADQAGYSFATIYNYFRHVNELVFLCVKDFVKECEGFVMERTIQEEAGLIKMKAAAKAYAAYFIEYPGIFELFFIEKMGDLGNKKDTAALISSSFAGIMAEAKEQCVEREIWSRGKAGLIVDQLNNTIIGLLLMYLNRMTPESYSKFIDILDQQVELIVTDN